MTIARDTGFPPTIINGYILSELAFYDLIPDLDLLAPGVNPMVPAQFPTNIEDLYNDAIAIRQTDSPVLIVYDRLMRFRPTPFYAHKREQLIYFIYSTDVGKLIDSVRVIASALDREDSSAQDVNSWSIANIESPNIFFHNTRVYQADESRDVAELASARTLFVNKIIVEYDYHVKTETDSRYT
jgi:hypothetical protein